MIMDWKTLSCKDANSPQTEVSLKPLLSKYQEDFL